MQYFKQSRSKLDTTVYDAQILRDAVVACEAGLMPEDIAEMNAALEGKTSGTLQKELRGFYRCFGMSYVLHYVKTGRC